MPGVKLMKYAYYCTHDHGGIVMLNMTSGTWVALNATASEFWKLWTSGTDFGDSVKVMTARYPDVALEGIRADADALVHDLEALGLAGAVPAAEPERHAVSCGAAVPGEAEGESHHRWFRRTLRGIAALTCLTVSFMLVRCSLGATVRLIDLARRRSRPGAADLRAACRAVTAVGRAAKFFPGRAACLELSVAAVLLAAIRGRRLDWCIGSAADPYQFHAWVESGGQVVPAPGRVNEDPRFLRMLTV